MVSLEPADKIRKVREELTRRAIAEILRSRISGARVRQMSIVRTSGVSRSHLRSLLRAEKQMSVFIFLELSEALRFEDPAEFLIEVLKRRAQLLAEHAQATLMR